MPAAARGRPARPHRVCPPAEGAVPPAPHLAEQQVLASPSCVTYVCDLCV